MVKQQKRLVVIGGGAAGMSAASRARRLQPDWEVIALERGPHVSFILCGLPYLVSDVVKDEESLVVYTPEYFQEERKIDVRTAHEVRRIDAQAGLVEAFSFRTGEKTSIPYDKLVIAAGAQPVRPNIPGITLDGVFTLRSLEGGVAIKEFLQTRKVRRAAIIGGGYIGLEMAESFRTAGAEVAIVEAADTLMPGSEPEIAQLIEEEVKRHQVEVRKQQLALSFEPDAEGAVEKVVTDQGDLEADVVVVAVGARPDVAIAREAGITLGETRAIATDDTMRTNLPNVYAAGDCVETRNIITGKTVYLPLGTTANKQGRVAGENAVGGHATFPGIVGSSAVKVFDLEVARTGLSEEQAKGAGFDPISSVVRFPSHSRFYPDSRPLTLKMVADKRSGRVLGAQMAGRDTVAKRIDVMATALYAKMTVTDIIRLDLTYSPPFATAWEGIQIAAQAFQRREPLAEPPSGPTAPPP
jgi:NADPH-dependent 2,4-dienoyl-CoA reductase/sulfur reductase-like enzyme